MFPEHLELPGKSGELLSGGDGFGRVRSEMLGDTRLDLPNTLERLVPPSLELIGDEAVFGIGGVVLPLRALSCIAGGLEVSLESGPHLGLLLSFLCVRQDCCLDTRPSHNARHFGCYRFINPTATEADAARQALIEPRTVAEIARDVLLAASVVHRDLRCAAPDAKKPRDQRRAFAGRSGRTRGDVQVPPYGVA